MSYIGNTSTTQAFTPAVDYFSGNASTTAFTLSRPVASVAQVQVVIDNVAQNPSSAYTVSSNTITFTSAPLSGTNNIYVYYTSPITQVIAPGQGTVNTTALGNITNIASGNSSLTFQTGSGNTTAVTVDTSQNVGIGTATPTDTSSFSRALDLNGTSGAGYYARTNGSATNYTIFGNYGADGYINNRGAGSFLLYNNNTERMRITSGGSVVMGGTSAPTVAGVGAQNGAYGPAGTGSWAMGLQQDTTSGGGGRILALRNATDFNNAGNEVIYYVGNTTARFYVLSNGGIYNYQANNSNLSDRREKTNFAPSKPYLDTVCAIPVQTFNYIDQNMEEDDGLTLGVVAQDVQTIAPELVKESNWGTQDEPKMRLSIYQTDLQYALMKSIQELKAINDTQAETINALTARIEALENR